MMLQRIPFFLALCVLAYTLYAFTQNQEPASSAASPTAAPTAAGSPSDVAKPHPQSLRPDASPAYGDETTSSSGYGKYSYTYTDKFSGSDWKIDEKHPLDGPLWPGRTSINDFRVEPRDVFHMMDQVMTPVLDDAGKPVIGPDGKTVTKLMPLLFNLDGTYNPNNPDQRAVFGRNTWLLWCGGNEDWSDWLAQNAYGVLDFLQAIDSRKRGSRLSDLGLINQPGMKGTDQPGPWGLYLDTVERDIGSEGDFKLPKPYSNYRQYSDPDPQGRRLKSDGVNPDVYGYPSGVIGLRLFPNPKFNKEAQKRWNADAFYNDPSYAADPRIARPYTVGMSCAACHVSVHPLNPPSNPEEPEWSNLSSIIGAQYFRTSGAFGSRVARANFLWHYLASQQPGCIDTSMVSSDQINNANAMNAVFELPARLRRSLLNPSEIQGSTARTLPGIGDKDRRIARVLMDGADSIGVFGALARVYLNIGLFHDEWNLTSNTIIGFVPQKPFSIDVCRRNSLYWRVNENFRVGYLQDFFMWEKKSPTEPRTKIDESRYQCSTQGMSLLDARVLSSDGKFQPFVVFPPDGKPEGQRVAVVPHDLRTLDGKPAPPAWDEPTALRGSKVFTQNCMICHSSKQPNGFKIEFAHQPPNGVKAWHEVAVDPDKLTLPYAEANWEDFKKSPAYAGYLEKARKLTGDTDWKALREFLKDNYLSTDLRIPVSLTETNSARAVGTNALENEVWAEFSSETYRSLPAVGKIAYTDPITRKETIYEPPGKGPGYYRVPSLVSIWATAPLLNNNALGFYIPDHEVNRRVSVEGRLAMFDDAITKLLWKSQRNQTPNGERGLRDPTTGLWWGSDPGWIFRTDVETEFRIPSGHLRHLVVGILPGVVPGWLGNLLLKVIDHAELVVLLLALLSLALLRWWRVGFFYLVTFAGVVLTAVLLATGVYHLLPGIIWLLPMALLIGGIAWIVTLRADGKAAKEEPQEPGKQIKESRAIGSTSTEAKEEEVETKKQRWLRNWFHVARWGGVAAYALFLIGLLVLLWTARELINGNLGDLRVGPFPKGMPVNTLMNMDPEAPILNRLGAVRGLCAMLGKLQSENAKERKSEEARRRYLEKHPAAPEEQWPKLYRFSEDQRLKVFEQTAGPALMKASKCPDFVLDRGHYFGEALTDEEKKDLIAFLKTL
jgi:hypothetical protein